MSLISEIERRRADEPGALVPVADDPPVLDLDPGGEVVGLAKTVFGAQALQVALCEGVRRRHVVLRHPELEWKLRHPLDRIRRIQESPLRTTRCASGVSFSRPLHARAFGGFLVARQAQGRAFQYATLAARRLEVRVCDIRVGRLHLHARAVAGCELDTG